MLIKQGQSELSRLSKNICLVKKKLFRKTAFFMIFIALIHTTWIPHYHPTPGTERQLCMSRMGWQNTRMSCAFKLSPSFHSNFHSIKSTGMCQIWCLCFHIFCPLCVWYLFRYITLHTNNINITGKIIHFIFFASSDCEFALCSFHNIIIKQLI